MRDHVAEYTIAKRVPFLNVDEPKHDGMADLINSESLLYLIIYAYTPPNTRIHTHTHNADRSTEGNVDYVIERRSVSRETS